MSLIYDKGKFKYYSNIKQIKSKKNNNNVLKNYPNKISGKNNLYNEYLSSSPFRIINNNNKKSAFLITYQNNKSYENTFNNKKNINKKKLEYNKSFEGNLLNNNIKFSKDFGNIDLYNIMHDKNQEIKKFNNSVILNNKQNNNNNKKKYNNKFSTTSNNSHIHKNHKKINIDRNLIIRNLDDKFKSLENNIIDKDYENDIDHDEMIISSNKKNINSFNINENNINNYKLSNILHDINIIKKEYNNNVDSLFMNMFSNKNDNYDEAYLLNTSFENNRNDFNIMYTDNYEESVMNDMLSLEIKLLIEKM